MSLHFESALFRGRVARRVFLLFLVCAVVPTSLLGWLSYHQVTDELTQQVSGRLRQESKAFGMSLYDRLLALQSQLDTIARRLPEGDRPSQAAALVTLAEGYRRQFRQLTIIATPGLGENPSNPPATELPFTEAQLRHLRAGKTVLLTASTSGQRVHFSMARAVDPDHPTAGVLVGYVNEQYLGEVLSRDILPAGTELHLLDAQRKLLYTTMSDGETLPTLPAIDTSTTTTASFRWQSGRTDYLAGSWKLPIRFAFASDAWTVVLSESSLSAFAPLDRFTQTFLLVLGASLGAVALLSTRQIRRSLQPLERLREGTDRIAKRDFVTRVEISSGDEFEDLATSFNGMAERLGRQFQLLDSMAAITRAILSAFDTNGIVEVLHARVRDILSCDGIGVLIVDPDHTGFARLSNQVFADVGAAKHHDIDLKEEDLKRLKAHPHHLLLTGREIPRFLEPLSRKEIDRVLVLPIMLQQSVTGVIALAYRRGAAPSEDDINHARQLADQVGVSLANSREMAQRFRAEIELGRAVDAKDAAEKQAGALEQANRSLQDKEERLRHQQAAVLTLIKDRMVYGGSVEEALKQITEVAADTLAIERTSVWLFADDRTSMRCLDLFERSRCRHSAGTRLDVRLFPRYFEELNRERVIAAGLAQQDPRTGEFTTDYLGPSNISSVLDAPIISQGTLVGVVRNEQVGAPREWEHEDERFVQAVANLVSLVLEAARRRAAEEALKKAKAVAEEATQAKASFLANMSHEIRTPMNGVIGMTDILFRTPLTATQRHYVETIRNSGETLLTLINDILDFSKIEAGRLELHPTDIDLRTLVENAVEQLAERAQRKGLRLLCWFDPEVPSALQGDAVRIKQVLTNLVGNAIKFTQRGDIVARVTLDGAGASENGAVPISLRVSDTGSGISQEGQAKLFQSFSQVDNSSTRVHGGTGLGLAICKQLSELMGGAIGVESELGQGSTFWVKLSLPTQIAGSAVDSASQGRLKGVRVCGVVADPGTRRLVERYLGSWGVVPTIASSGTEALTVLMDAVASGDAPVIVLVDETVPDMEQAELLEAIRTDACFTKLPVLRLASFIHRVETEQDARFGAIPFVTKPIRYDTLRETLVGLLEVPQSGRISSAETARSRAGEAGPQLSGRVLLAEDNPVNQEVAVLMLESLGCTVEVVRTGREVVEASQRAGYDVILMDCQMPEMDGFSATRLIREREKPRSRERVPIIALTAHASLGDREQCLAAGMDDYFTKPFTQEKLREVLGRWLKERPATDRTAPPSPHAAVHSSKAPVPAAPVSADAAVPEAVATAINRKAWDAITMLQRPGQPDALAKILSLYLSDSHQLVDKLRKAVQDREAKLVNEAAHSLKSRSAALGAVSLADLCKQLERLGRTGDLTEAPGLIKQLESEFAEACAVFSDELQKRAA